MRGNFRGSRRPYGSRSYGSSRGGTPSSTGLHASRSIPPALGTFLSSLKVADLDEKECPLDEAKITDREVVSSYNLMDRNSTTILVPGAPPAWTPTSQPARLKDDEGGEYLRDENAARFPEHPMEPAVQSVFAKVPCFDTSTVDVFACGSTLGNLIQFVHEKKQAFCFVVRIVGNTAFFIRRNHSPSELIDGVFGYGHAFPEAYTTWESDVKGSTSHQRIIGYSFGGLRFLTRFESDGYLRDRKHPEGGAKQRESFDSAPPIEDLMAGLLGKTETPPIPNVNIKAGGHYVDQADVFDLKTRSIKKIGEDILQAEMPRMWVRQIPNFILAFHTSGVFNEIRVIDIADKVQDWEASAEVELRKFSALVYKIISMAKQQPGNTMEVRGTETCEMEFSAVEGTGWDALPQELEDRWSRQEASDGSEDEDEVLEGVYSRRGVSLDQEDEEETKDYTACSAEDCGYCGRCSY